jgi:hypothetical protein
MRNFFGPIMPFVVLIKIVGLPNGRVLLPGIFALAAFLALSAGSADMPLNERFIWSMVAGWIVILNRKLAPTYLRLENLTGPRSTAVMLFAMIVGPVWLVAWTRSPDIIQHLFTLAHAGMGLLYASEVITKDFSATKKQFSHSFFDGAHENIARLLAVAYVSFALLNETLIQQLPLTGWLVFWALFPVLGHVIREGLVTAAMIAHDQKSRL